MSDNDDLDELAADLQEFAPPEKSSGRPPREERIIAGFEEVQRFVEQHGRAPQHGEDRDIFERLYAVRLDRLRTSDECRAIIAPLDAHGLLNANVAVANGDGTEIDDEALAAELADAAGAAGAASITELRHVRPAAEKTAAEEIANREKCDNFDEYKPLFEKVREELKAGIRQTLPVHSMQLDLDQINAGEFFILNGQIAYIAGAGEDFKTNYERRDSRLRVIYDNATESNLLMRSFQRALHRDESGRLITKPESSAEQGSLFADEHDANDLASGTIYVLRSKSEHPTIAEHRELLHKIGVTGSDVTRRIAGAKDDPTYLMADVEVVATYNLYNINRTKLENVIHRVFAAAQLSIEIKDRFGKLTVPREWFLVPLFIVDQAVERIKDSTITNYIYDPQSATLKFQAANLPTNG